VNPLKTAIGLVETNSIALGVKAADAMLKTAAVELLLAEPTSPGKYLAVIGGDVAAVMASVEAGSAAAGGALVDSLIIPNLHVQVMPAIKGEANPQHVNAIGVVETYTVAAAIRAGDAAVKTAAVELLELRMARGLGGKGFVTFTGDVGSVQAAVEAAAAAASESGALQATVVIPSPHGDLKGHLRKAN
jgi:microcompartment protein CcmL/EutN